jgi:hypothetical protein
VAEKPLASEFAGLGFENQESSPLNHTKLFSPNLLLQPRLFSSGYPAKRFLKKADELLGAKQKKVCRRRMNLWVM